LLLSQNSRFIYKRIRNIDKIASIIPDDQSFIVDVIETIRIRVKRQETLNRK